MKFKDQEEKIRFIKHELKNIHSYDSTIFYCDILYALSIILEEHRIYYENSIKKQGTRK